MRAAKASSAKSNAGDRRRRNPDHPAPEDSLRWAGHADVYRGLVRLYPRAFRHDYADDLVQNFTDLLAHHGASRTWRRTAIDLAVTVPRYRLETVMNPRHTDTTLYIATAVVAVAAAVSILTDVVPGGFALLLAAAVLTVVSASRLARSTRPPDTDAGVTC